MNSAIPISTERKISKWRTTGWSRDLKTDRMLLTYSAGVRNMYKCLVCGNNSAKSPDILIPWALGLIIRQSRLSLGTDLTAAWYSNVTQHLISVFFCSRLMWSNVGSNDSCINDSGSVSTRRLVECYSRSLILSIVIPFVIWDKTLCTLYSNYPNLT